MTSRRSRSSGAWISSVAALLVLACTPAPKSPVLSEVDGARQSPAAREAAELAPQAYLHAEKLRREAQEALAQEDPSGAQILGERALTAYSHAAVVARIAKAQARLKSANDALTRAQSKLAELDAEHALLASEADQLELKLKVQRDALPLLPNAPATPEREEARRLAAQAMGLRARFLCVAARMLAKEDTTAALLAELERLDTTLRAKPRVVPIDDAMRLNNSCLAALSSVRRQTKQTDSVAVADGLLQELSDLGGLLPFRDDRGVVVTLRELAGPGGQLRAETEEVLKTLGRVAKAHATLPLLVIYHAGRGAATEAQQRLAESIAASLRKNGADRIAVQAVGGLQPLLDWKQRDASARNTRLEIVFVVP